MYSLTVSLCYELKEASDKGDKDFDNMVDRFLRFMMDNFETELVVMGVQLVRPINHPIDPDEVECFDEFHDLLVSMLPKHNRHKIWSFGHFLKKCPSLDILHNICTI